MKRTAIFCLLAVAAGTTGAWSSERVLNCSDQTYSLPAVRYMHKIRTVDSAATVKVENLPQGLVWNERRKLVEGKVDTEGDYVYNVIVNGSDTVPVTLTVSSSLPMPTPMMGWLSWNVVLANVSESLLRETADAMHEKGLYDAG